MTALVCIGCTAPAAQESQAPSDYPDSDSLAERIRHRHADAIGHVRAFRHPMPTLAFEPPDGLLPPDSIVAVVVDELQLRAEPGLAAAVTGLASAGDQFMVAGWFGPSCVMVWTGTGWVRP